MFSKKTINIIVMIMYTFLHLNFSCALITWDELQVGCSIEQDDYFFYAEGIDLVFSLEVDIEDLRSAVTLERDEKSVRFDVEGDGRTATIIPVEWSKGSKYQLSLKGTVGIVDGGTYDVFLQRTFIYGEEEKMFLLDESAAPKDTMDGLEEPLVFVFNQSVDKVSFLDGFSLNPYTDLSTSFSDDGSVVVVRPKSKWSLNKRYGWTLRNLVSSEGYRLVQEYEGEFETLDSVELPLLEKLCPVEVRDGILYWHEQSKVDGQLRDAQGIGLVFSKPMDFVSVSNALAVTPVVKGQLLPDRDNPCRFVWLPSQNWQIDTLYSLLIDDSASDTEGKTLFETSKCFFKVFNQHLAITNISLDDNLVVTDFDDKNLACFLPRCSDGTLACEGEICFSSPIELMSRFSITELVGFEPLFPITGENPVIESVDWNEDGTSVVIRWRGFTPSSDTEEYFYRLTIFGGKNGIKSMNGDYLKEDICVTLNIL